MAEARRTGFVESLTIGDLLRQAGILDTKVERRVNINEHPGYFIRENVSIGGTQAVLSMQVWAACHHSPKCKRAGS